LSTNRLALRLALIGLCLQAMHQPLRAQPLTRTVALIGDDAPGTPLGVVFAWGMEQAVIDSAGDIAFWSMLAGPGIGDPYQNAGIWLRSGAGLALVARGLQPAPGMPQGVYFNRISSSGLVLADTGLVGFQTGLDDPVFYPVNVPSAWVGTPNDIAAIVRRGDHAPGTPPNVVFGTPFSASSFYISGPAINSAGQSVFSAQLESPQIIDNQNGVWTGRLVAYIW